MTTIKAKVLNLLEGSHFEFYQMEVLESYGEVIEVPESNLFQFAKFPSSLLDESQQHLRVGAIIELRYEGNGKYLPALRYSKKVTQECDAPSVDELVRVLFAKIKADVLDEQEASDRLQDMIDELTLPAMLHELASIPAPLDGHHGKQFHNRKNWRFVNK